jgi:regulatory protein
LKLTRAEQAKKFALKLLALQPRSEAEVRAKLKKKGFSQEIIKNLLEELKHLNYLNDYQFAEDFIEKTLRRKPVSKRFLTMKLQAKDVSPEVINQVLERKFSSLDETELALKLVETKNFTSKEKRKVYYLLHRYGFSEEVISEVFQKIGFGDEG